jgi:hypothetical protein
VRRTVALIAAAVALAACSSGPKRVATRVTPSEPPSASASRTPGPPALPGGLTGLRGGTGRPMLAVKIDNTRPAHPQVAVGAADIVYVEQVEGSLTRLLAIFSSSVPKVVGPVRSARESDLELLRQYGRVVLAFAGANRGVTAAVQRAPVSNGSFNVVPAAYYRDYSRRAPYNLFLRPATLLAARRAVSGHDIGLRFRGAPPAGGTPTRGFSIRFGPYASAVVARSGTRWTVAMDQRRPGAAPQNVVVQYVPIRRSRYRDVLGNPSPYTVTVGAGAAVVYRDGRAYRCRWSRPTADLGTRFLDAAGHDLPLRPGRTWVLLVPASARLRPL